jgi:hypothetical protein
LISARSAREASLGAVIIAPVRGGWLSVGVRLCCLLVATELVIQD